MKPGGIFVERATEEKPAKPKNRHVFLFRVPCFGWLQWTTKRKTTILEGVPFLAFGSKGFGMTGAFWRPGEPTTHRVMVWSFAGTWSLHGP